MEADRRRQLIDLGIGLFSGRSYDAVSIDDIAAAAAISKGLLYHYFGGKRDFYVVCVQTAADRLLEATAIAPDLSEEDQARHGLAAYLTFVRAHREAFRALLGGGRADPIVAGIIDQTRDALVARAAGELGPAGERPVWRMAIRAWIGGVEQASLAWLQTDAPGQDVLVELLLGTLLGALQTASSLDPVDATT